MRRLLAMSAALLLVAACEAPNTHILAGQLYIPEHHCIGATSGFDVVNGGSVPTNCGPLCLSVGAGDAQAVYITTMCGPYPSDYAVEGENAARDAADPCIGAFQAYVEDGGLCPATLLEGGEADAGTDSTVDGSPDATVGPPLG